MSKCKSCGADIIWIKTAAGKNMPCDAQPISYDTAHPATAECVQGGRQVLTLVTPDGRITRGIYNPESEKYGYLSHFSTCPNADSFRKGKGTRNPK